MKLIQSVRVSALLLSAGSVFLVAGPARCATYNVTSLADDGGPGQLRAAISAANANAGSTITFQSGLSGTITLSPTLQALPTILVPTTIQGPGRSLIAVDGRSAYRPFQINAPGARVDLSGLTIQNGADAGGTGGGGILLMAGDLTLHDCTLSGNTATGSGGGLSNFGTATITNCTFSNNHGYNGGGIYNYTYSRSGGLATLTNCTLTQNSATINGGGVYDYTYSGTGGSTTFTTTTLSGNSAGTNGAGIYNYSYSGSGGNAVLTNCVVTKNSSSYGGGIYDYTETGSGGTAILTDCTVADNTGSYTGGIYNYSYSGSGGTAALKDCILYGDAGGELFGSVSAVYSDIQGGYVGLGNVNANPLFVSLTDLHLQPNSPCLGAGTSAGAPPTDFEGTMRPNPPSIGAYEVAAGSTHVLWTNPDGRTIFWDVSPSGAPIVAGNYDPLVDPRGNGGYVAKSLSTGTDGVSHILWSTPDGHVALWDVNVDGTHTDSYYGPFSDDGTVATTWQPVAVSTGGNGVTHLLWDNPNGRTILWDVQTGSQTGDPFTVVGNYDGFSDDGTSQTVWKAVALASGPDGLNRVLWDNADGHTLLWNLDAADDQPAGGSQSTSFLYPLMSDDGTANTIWHSQAVSVGQDNVPRLLWTNPDGRTILWNVSTDGTFAITGNFDPLLDPAGQGGFTAVALATGFDNRSHFAWDNANGETYLWNLLNGGGNGTNAALTSVYYGVFSDDGTSSTYWKAVAISAAPAAGGG